MIKRLPALACFLLLSACASAGNNYSSYLSDKGIRQISPQEIPNCRGYGCRTIDTLSLSEQDWIDIESLFVDVYNPISERQAIAKAINLFEIKIGKLNGTSADKGGTFSEWSNTQQDCVDESTNTTIDLIVLKQKGLLRYHDVARPVGRMPIWAGKFWPHQTAVITDRQNGNQYAVDSWFRDNGTKTDIVPLPRWVGGWSPE